MVQRRASGPRSTAMTGLLERQYLLVESDKAIGAPQRYMVRQLGTLGQSQPNHTHSIVKVF
jgi:hypothetical protein